MASIAGYFDLLSGVIKGAEISAGEMRADHIAVRLDCKGAGADLRLPASGLPMFWPLVIENINENSGLWLLDRTRKAPNLRQLPVAEGTGYAVVPSDEPRDLFIGHPVVADVPEVVISICNLLPGRWQVTLHNPTDEPISTEIRSAPAWTPFTLPETEHTIPPGSSVDIVVPADRTGR